MYDRSNKKLIWTGTAEGNIYDTRYFQDEIHPAVHDIIKSFPIKPNKRVRIRNNKILNSRVND